MLSEAVALLLPQAQRHTRSLGLAGLGPLVLMGPFTGRSSAPSAACASPGSLGEGLKGSVCPACLLRRDCLLQLTPNLGLLPSQEVFGDP